SSRISQQEVEDISYLVLAASVSPIAQMPHVSRALSKILAELPSFHKHEMGRILRACRVSRSTRRGISVNDQILKDMLIAVRMNRKVRLTMHIGCGKKTQTKLSPYGVEVDANQFLVVGRSTLHRKMCRFDLALIDKVEVLDEEISILPSRLTRNRDTPVN